jgi:hypothetical protein
MCDLINLFSHFFFKQYMKIDLYLNIEHIILTYI